MPTNKKLNFGPENFEPYFNRVMKFHAAYKKMVREDAVKPSEALFADYNKIVAAPPDKLGALKTELAASLEKTRGEFDAIKKKMNKIKEPSEAPFGLRLALGGMREKARKHILDSIKAADSLIKYLDTGDSAELATAHGLLLEMTFAAEVKAESPMG